jgi:hypothetical protein
MSVEVNMSAVSWNATVDVSRGSNDPLSHMSESSLKQTGKLGLAMHLRAEGWVPRCARSGEQFYAEGLPREFDMSMKRPRLYFLALAKSSEIFLKMSRLDGLPTIYHGLPESYYNGLLTLQSAAALAKLQELIDGTHDVSSLTDTQFSELLPRQGTGLALKEDALASTDKDHFDVLAALTDRPRDEQRDVETMQRTALAVLRSIPHESVDLRGAMMCKVAGRSFTAHLDNCTHSSGKQRAYIKCPNTNHTACFKYGIVDQFDSIKHACAWLIAWAAHAHGKGAEFTKLDHMRFKPSDSDCRVVFDIVEDV